MRNYSKEYEWEKETYKRFVAKLTTKEAALFEGIPRASFLRWCIENGYVEKYKDEHN